ncbi:MAG: hypothetical protein AB1Z98_37870 [Nannocystaceae bacterium]
MLRLLSPWLLAWAAAADEPPVEDPAVVLMAPDLPDEDVDERLIATISAAAASEGAASLHVVRYDPAAFDPSTLVELSQRRAAEHLAGAVLWIDLRGPSSYSLYLFEVAGQRVLGRRVPVGGEGDGGAAVAHEALANIATSVVAESVEGPVSGLAPLDPITLQEAPAEPEPAPETEPAPEPATPPESKPTPEPTPPVAAPADELPRPTFPRLWLTLGYAGTSISNDPVLGHALTVGTAWAPAPGAFVGGRYDVALPLTVDEPQVRISLRRHPISLEGGYRFGLAPRWDLELAGRVSIDPIRRVTDERSALAPTTDAWRVFSSGALSIGAGVTPIRELRVGLRLGVEGLMTRADYVAAQPELRVIFSPHPVRGFVELGLGFATLWRPKKK